jgi:hypothetical protein
MTAKWRKSSHSGSSSSDLDCVEVAQLSDGVIGIRDSKKPDEPHLVVPAEVFGRFLRRIRER